VIANGWKSVRNGLRLAPGPANPYRTWPEEAQLASGDRLEDEIDGTGSAERDAFTVLVRLYGLFGLPASGIPFTANDAVSVELLKRPDRINPITTMTIRLSSATVSAQNAQVYL